MMLWVLCFELADPKSEIQYAQQIKKLLQTIPKDTFLQMKSLSGHMKRYYYFIRIALISNDNKLGIRSLIKAICSLLAPLIFNALFKLPTVLQIPSLEVGSSFPLIIFEDSSTEDVMINEKLKLLTYQKSDITMTPKTPMNNETTIRSSLMEIGSSETELITEECDHGEKDSFYRQSRGASAKYDNAFSLDILDTSQETNNRLRDSYAFLKKEELDQLLFCQQYPMVWYSYVLEILIRYWDYIFEKFEIGKIKPK
jgi:hypothetical protein